MSTVKFDDFVAELRRRTPKPVATGFRDVDGREICTGDIVRFWFSADTGFSSTPADGATPMTDVVEVRDGGILAIEYDMIGGTNMIGGMWLWKVDEVCLVIGDIHTNPEPLRDGLVRFAGPSAVLPPKGQPDDPR